MKMAENVPRKFHAKKTDNLGDKKVQNIQWKHEIQPFWENGNLLHWILRRDK